MFGLERYLKVEAKPKESLGIPYENMNLGGVVRLGSIGGQPRDNLGTA